MILCKWRWVIVCQLLLMNTELNFLLFHRMFHKSIANFNKNYYHLRVVNYNAFDMETSLKYEGFRKGTNFVNTTRWSLLFEESSPNHTVV